MSHPIAYEKHPVTPERKAELRSQGFKIIDAKFAPDDAKPASKPTKRSKAKPAAKRQDQP